MQVLIKFVFVISLGLYIAGCGSKAETQGESSGQMATDSSASAPDATAAEIEVPPFSADRVRDLTDGCDNLLTMINDQIMTKEYELSQQPGDQELTDVVAKLKEYQVGLSQLKGKLSKATADDWGGVYKEFYAMAVESKTLLKSLLSPQ